MPQKRSAVEQRREQITTQVERLRRQIASKTRKDYISDFHYERWIRQSRELIDELLEELSALNEPGEYDQLPVAVVADEIGLRLDQVKQLIKLGDVEAAGRRAHERVSRRELERLAGLGIDELLRQSAQSADIVFGEAVSQLRRGDVASTERAYLRLKARQSCIGNHALATEVAIKLTKGLYAEAERIIKFILMEKFYERGVVGSYLSEFVREACFRDEDARAVISDLLKLLIDVSPEIASTDRDPEDLQATAMHIILVVGEGLEELKMLAPPVNQREEFYRLLRDRIFSVLYARANLYTSTKSRMFILAAKQRLPLYWEQAKLPEELRED
jgi:hypothetical protein